MTHVVDLRPLGEACRELVNSFIQVLIEVQHTPRDSVRLESLAEDLSVNLEEVVLNILLGPPEKKVNGFIVEYREEILNPDDSVTRNDRIIEMPGATSLDDAKNSFYANFKNTLLVRYSITNIEEAQ